MLCYSKWKWKFMKPLFIQQGNIYWLGLAPMGLRNGPPLIKYIYLFMHPINHTMAQCIFKYTKKVHLHVQNFFQGILYFEDI
jgi:hypothetical protein